MLVFYSEVIKKAKKSIQAVTLLEYLPPKLFSVVVMASAGYWYLYCIINNSTAGKITISSPSR